MAGWQGSAGRKFENDLMRFTLKLDVQVFGEPSFQTALHQYSG